MLSSIINLKNLFFSAVFCLLLSLNANASDISAIDFNGELIGKVIPDGSVVNYNNELVGKITADGFVINDNNTIIGGVIPQGIAISFDNSILGKVNNDGTITSYNNAIVGKILPNGIVVNDRYDILGEVISPGLVYNDEGKIVGRVSGDGLFYNLSGVKSGYVTSSGFVYKISNLDNSKELIGKLISSKTVVSTTGKFLGSVSPDGKVIDLNKRVVGLVHANGFVYNDNEDIIGMLVKDEFAFDKIGNPIGFVSYNGEVVDKDEVKGYSIYGNRIIDKENNIIGFTVKTNATANTLEGKYLGQIDINGNIAKGKDIVGKVASSSQVINEKGDIIGLINSIGPVFNYVGKNIAFATTGGKVISLDGVELGYVVGNIAFDNKNEEIGKVLENRVSFDITNNFMGINGIDSKIKYSGSMHTISPYGYIFDEKGMLSGGNYPLSNVITSKGDILSYTSLTGNVEEQSLVDVSKLTSTGFYIDKNNNPLGQISNYIYATNFMGDSLGYVNQANIYNRNTPIAKIMAGGDIVSTKNNQKEIIGKAEKARQSISFNGDFIGFNNINGVVIKGKEQIGKVTSQSQVIDNSGVMYGKALNYGNVVSNKCEFLGVVSNNGDVRKLNNSLLGTVLGNNQVINETEEIIGFVVEPQIVIGKKGEVLGAQTPLGTVLNYNNEKLGCQDLYGNIRNAQNEIIGIINPLTPIMDFSNKIVGNTDFSGKIYNSSDENIGYVDIDGGAYSNNNDSLGVLFKYSVAFDNNNIYAGRIDKNGKVISDLGEIIGNVDYKGEVRLKNNDKGFALYDLYIYDNEGKTVGYIAKNGRAYSIMGDIIGSIDKGFIVDKNQNITARGSRDYFIRDNQNKILGYLNLNGDVTNTNNAVIGKIQANGDIINNAGEIIAKANDLQYYKKTTVSKNDAKKSNKKLEEESTSDNNEDVVDIKDEVTSSEDKAEDKAEDKEDNVKSQASSKNIKKADKTIAKHKAIGIAVTPGGKYIGDIYDNGDVVDEKGNIVARETEDGSIVDSENNKIGERVKQELSDIKIDEKRLKQISQGATVSPYSNSLEPTNVGPGGGVGPGGRYNPRRAAIVSQLQNSRRQSLSGKKIQSVVNGDAYTGWQEDWGYSKTTISSLRVDMSNMITGDKPIPAVLARSIISLGSAPITAIVERNVYADAGRNVIIPAGSRIIGGMDEETNIGESSRFNGESGGVKLEISWDRIIRPDGITFMLDADQTADAQGRGGGALGYVDEQLIKKYGMPLASTIATSAVAYMMAANEDATGEVETSKQQAASDARQEFLTKMDEIISEIMEKKSEIQAVTFVPAGTRIIIYPLSDLWLRTKKDIIEGRETTVAGEVENVLISDEEDKINNNQNVTVQGGQSSNRNQPQQQATPLIADDTNSAQNQANNRNNIGAIPPPAADGTISHNPYTEEDSGDIELEF